MQTKGSTDIDRKLAIYYHPLFQEVIKSIIDLFKISAEKFEIGLLEFVEFNLKLQKALLPTFQIDNALISGLNDWVKEVAQCLTYEGMVSTAQCVEITANNIQQVIERELSGVKMQMFENKENYIQQLMKISNHDAFKLLGVKINKEVFSKFMFDLCSTWCEFLDVELFSYFLIGLYMQISEGETIDQSNFSKTDDIEPIDLEFMEEFEEIKSQYNKTRKKELRYYRAWCEWNYLRVNEVGERLILKLDELHADDARVLQLAMLFQNAIQIINEEITNQNPQKQEKQNRTIQEQNKTNQDFLILKKLNIDSKDQQQQQQHQAKEKHDGHDNEAQIHGEEDTMEKKKMMNQGDVSRRNSMENFTTDDQDAFAQDFEIQIDEEGNMYLKRIVKLPILGVKIEPEPFHNKMIYKRDILEKKKEEFRGISNLYKKMDPLKIRLEHNVKNDHYAVKVNPKIIERDRFYEKNQKNSPEKRKKEMDKTIHEKKLKPEQPKIQSQIQIPNIKKQDKVSLRETKNYIHRVMAPSFLTDNENNLSFADKQGQIYSNTANNEKRELKIGLPKIKHIDFRVKQLKSYHIVGKLANDRSLINQKVRSASISMGQDHEKTRIEKEREQNKHIWSRYAEEEEVMQLTNYQDFYSKLEQAKRRFGFQFQSQFRKNLKPMLAYENKRYEMGGILTKEDEERFSERINRLINKENRRNRRRKRKEKMREYRRNFKSKNEKSLFEDIFIKYHRDAIKDIKNDRKVRHNSVIYK